MASTVSWATSWRKSASNVSPRTPRRDRFPSPLYGEWSPCWEVPQSNHIRFMLSSMPWMEQSVYTAFIWRNCSGRWPQIHFHCASPPHYLAWPTWSWKFNKENHITLFAEVHPNGMDDSTIATPKPSWIEAMVFESTNVPSKLLPTPEVFIWALLSQDWVLFYHSELNRALDQVFTPLAAKHVRWFRATRNIRIARYARHHNWIPTKHTEPLSSLHVDCSVQCNVGICKAEISYSLCNPAAFVSFNMCLAAVNGHLEKLWIDLHRVSTQIPGNIFALLPQQVPPRMTRFLQK